jgi:putative tricarboxylic transport membrane protein
MDFITTILTSIGTEMGNLFGGFATVLQLREVTVAGMTFSIPVNVLLMVVGILLGIIIGVLPGLGGANGVAILLPITFTMSPTSAIILLSCIYWGALFGGAITSILFNIPGEPWSVATTFDGYPMAQQGRAGEALTAAFTSSFVGALFAVILITLVAPLVAGFALKFGAAEKFAVYFLAFCSFVGLSKEPPFKTLAAMMIGFALATFGTDHMTGSLRLTFGQAALIPGFDFLIAVIGLFGIGEILLTMEEGLKFKGREAKINLKIVLQTWKELPKYWSLSLRSCIIGCWMGITPAGATPASFMSYGIAKRMSKRGKNFGNGEIEGVVAPETAAHAAGTAALLPMLALGVPGSPTAAVLLGGLLIWNLQPGPMLFVESPGKEFVWGLIASMYLGNLVGLIIVLTCVPLLAAILRIPFGIIAPVILVFCAIGAYTVHNSTFDVVLMLIFGILGYVLKKCQYPLAPLVLAMVLGDKAEEAFRQAIVSSGGNLGVFFSNGLVSSIMVLGLIALFWGVISAGIAKLRSGKPATA